MPTFNLTLDFTQEEAEKIQRFFLRWNADLKVPYASIEDALEDHMREQAKAWLEDQDKDESPMENSQWDLLTTEEKEQVKAIMKAAKNR
jgi:hypothetical protein